MSLADDCRALLRALPAVVNEPAANYPREEAARLWTALRSFPPDVDDAARAAGVDLWPAIERLSAVVTHPRSWRGHEATIAADLQAIIAACDGAPVAVAASATPEPVAMPDDRPLPVTGDRATNPAAIERATPGRHREAGFMYGQAGAWLESLDPALAERLHAIGEALRALHRHHEGGPLAELSKPSADEVYRVVVGGKRGAVRAVQARFFSDGARLLESHAQSLPPALVAWLVPRLRATATALDNMADARPANAVLRALGAARDGQRGRPAADDLQDERDALLVWEVADQIKRHPGVPLRPDKNGEVGVFERVARLWRKQISAAVVEDAWRRRHLFLN